MGSYNLCSSLTIPGLLPGSIKSKPDGFQMFSLLTPVVISLFFIRRDKFWLREISLPVNNAIKNKSGALLSVDPANSCARLCSCHCRLGTGRGGGTSRWCPTAAPAAFGPFPWTRVPESWPCFSNFQASSSLDVRDQEMAQDLGMSLSPGGDCTHPCPDSTGTELPIFWGSRLFPWG